MNDNKIPETLDELPIKLFKLMNGDSIIAYTHDLDNEYSIGLEEPMNVKVNTSQEYELTPWLPFSDGRVHILDNMNIVIDSPVNNSMKAEYMRFILDTVIQSPTTPIDTSTVLH